MSTRKLSVLVACLVLAVVLCLRWYLQVEAPVYAGPPELYESIERKAGCIDGLGGSWRDLSLLDADDPARNGAS